MSTNATTRDNQREKDLKFLCVEDNPDILESLLDDVRHRFNPESRGARSFKAAQDLLDEEEFLPDLVIHDCKPLRYDQDELDSEEAGNELYAFFIDKKLPVAVLSGNNAEEMLDKEPYRSDPPLTWLDKPLRSKPLPDGGTCCAQIDEAVEAYLKWRGGAR